MDLSPARSSEVTSEVRQALDQFEAIFPLLFILIEIFNILVSEISLRHRELHNKFRLVGGFDTVDLLVD